MLSNNLSQQINTKRGIVTLKIDSNSGFCFGVINAIQLAEDELKQSGKLVSLGNIVHNEQEVDRLNETGLTTANYNDFQDLNNSTILFRAHGEPPKSYEIAAEKKLKVIDATCPVVLKLQQRIKKAWDESEVKNTQVVIYGKKGHAEVLGLLGQTNNQAIVIESELDIIKLNKQKPAVVFAQTTMSVENYNLIGEKISNYIVGSVKVHDTICRQVANRAPMLREFVKLYDIVVFVGGTKSSNAKYLYSVCKEHNPNTIFVSSPSELKASLFLNSLNIGICGATSTPLWLMVKIADEIKSMVIDEDGN